MAEPVVVVAAAARVVAPAPTTTGLPRRVPQASLAPELLATPATRPAEPPSPARSPEEVRTMLSRFQAAQQRGRAEVSAPTEES